MKNDTFLEYIFDILNFIINRNSIKIVFNNDFVIDNKIDLNIDGNDVTSVLYSTSQLVTMNNLISQIESDIPNATAELDSSDINNRTIIITITYGHIEYSNVVVTLGVNQPTGVISFYNDNDIPIVRGGIKFPQPNGLYLCYYRLNTNNVGLGNEKGIETDDNGILSHYNRYQISLSIEEIAGYGDYLGLIKEYMCHQSVMDYCKGKGVYFLNYNTITDITDITENDFEKRYIMDCTVLYSELQKEYSSWIETVEYTNNIL